MEWLPLVASDVLGLVTREVRPKGMLTVKKRTKTSGMLDELCLFVGCPL